MSAVSEGTLVPFDSSMALPSDSTIGELYNAITSLTSFENEMNLWDEYVKETIPIHFGSVSDCRDHASEIKNAIILGISEKFHLKTGLKMMKAHEVIAMSVAEVARVRALTKKERKADKSSVDVVLKGRLAKLVILINKRANARFNRMIEKYFPEDVTVSSVVCTQVNHESNKYVLSIILQ